MNELSEPDRDTGRRVLSADVKERLLRGIVEGKLAPGSRLVETRMARELGVSQAPVREALRELAGLGLIELETHRSARVRAPTRDELVEAIGVRGELEAMGSRLAAPRITEEDLAALDELVTSMRGAAATDDVYRHASRNAELHGTVMRASGNATLYRTWRFLDPLPRTYLTAAVTEVGLVPLGDRHSAWIDALRSRDPEEAERASRRHTRETIELVASSGDSPLLGSPGDPDRDDAAAPDRAEEATGAQLT